MRPRNGVELDYKHTLYGSIGRILKDCLPNNAPIDVVSPSIVKILQETMTVDEVQYCEAVNKCKDGDIMDYKALNLLIHLPKLEHIHI